MVESAQEQQQGLLPEQESYLRNLRCVIKGFRPMLSFSMNELECGVDTLRTKFLEPFSTALDVATLSGINPQLVKAAAQGAIIDMVAATDIDPPDAPGKGREQLLDGTWVERRKSHWIEDGPELTSDRGIPPAQRESHKIEGIYPLGSIEADLSLNQGITAKADVLYGCFYDALRLMERKGMKLEDDEIRKVGRLIFVATLAQMDFDSAAYAQRHFGIPTDEAQVLARSALGHYFSIYKADEQLVRRFSKDYSVSDDEIRSIARQSFIHRLDSDRPGGDQELVVLMNHFGVDASQPEIQEAAKAYIVRVDERWDGMGESGVVKDWETFLQFDFPFSDVIIQDPVIQRMARRALATDLSNYLETGGGKEQLLGAIESVTTKFRLPAEEVLGAKKLAISIQLLRDIDKMLKGSYWQIRSFGDNAARLGLSDFGIDEYLVETPVALRSMFSGFGVTTVGQMSDFIRFNSDYVQFVLATPNVSCEVRSSESDTIRQLHISLREAEVLKRAGHDLGEFVRLGDYKGLYEALCELEKKDWGEPVIAVSFRRGAEVFGYERMFAYIDRRVVDQQTHNPGLALATPRHAALYAFDDILELYRFSGLTPDQFYGNILQQVQRDDAGYPEGNAHHHMSELAQSIDPDVAEVLEIARQYPQIAQLQDLLSHFDSPKTIFTSWPQLRRFSSLEQLLGQRRVFDELVELRQQGKEALYQYVETLAFHPDSKVDMQAVMEFWRDPDRFLARAASHTPDEVQDRKKPSNYVEIPNLDLTAEELRDALVERVIDKVQVFHPMEIHYEVAVGQQVDDRPLTQIVGEAVGIAGKALAVSPERVRKNLEFQFRKYGVTISVDEFVAGAALPEVEGVDWHGVIEGIVFNAKFGVRRPAGSTERYIATIVHKGDPDGVLSGNDIANCMPFGDGKATVYTFNPNTSLFLIQVERDDGTRKTIAASVLTKDVDTGTPIGQVAVALRQHGKRLDEVVPSDLVTADRTAYIACDNTEVHSNYDSGVRLAAVEAIYHDFFREYLKRFAGGDKLTPDTVVIGTSYSKALTRLPTRPNTFIPQAPVSYSDKSDDVVYVLKVDEQRPHSDSIQLLRGLPQVAVQPPQVVPVSGMKELRYLTFEDALRVTYLEGKAYADNLSLMQHLHNMENALIAKDINNAAKGRPNISLQYVDPQGRTRGYILAYQGKLDDADLKRAAPEFYDQPAIYISDIATDKGDIHAGTQLLNGFAELYKQHYADVGNQLPIYAQMRESHIEGREGGSYRIVARGLLQRLAHSVGVEFEVVELPTYRVGDDTMHPVIIKPKGNQVDAGDNPRVS